MPKVVLKSQEDILRYAREHTYIDRAFADLQANEKAHRDIYEYARTHTPEEVKTFAHEMYQTFRERATTRASIYAWYANHVVS